MEPAVGKPGRLLRVGSFLPVAIHNGATLGCSVCVCARARGRACVADACMSRVCACRDQDLPGLKYCACRYITPVFGAMALLPSVQVIAPFTKLANALVLGPITVVVAYAVARLVKHGVGDGVALARPENPSAPLILGTAVFCFSGITNLLPVENSLEEPEDIWSVVGVGMAVVGAVFFAVGALPHLAWPVVTEGADDACTERERARENTQELLWKGDSTLALLPHALTTCCVHLVRAPAPFLVSRGDSLFPLAGGARAFLPQGPSRRSWRRRLGARS